MLFKIVRNDITKMNVDAIVNTANAAPIYSSGTDTAVYKAAGRFGIGANRAVNYECDSVGTQLNYRVISEAVSKIRMCAPMQMDDALGDDWKAEIEADYKRRHRR